MCEFDVLLLEINCLWSFGDQGDASRKMHPPFLGNRGHPSHYCKDKANAGNLRVPKEPWEKIIVIFLFSRDMLHTG